MPAPKVTIKSKITLFTSAFLVLMLVLFQVVNFFATSKEDSAPPLDMSAQILDGRKQHLKDLVDVAYSNIDKSYAKLSDEDYLNKAYASKLNNIVDAGDGIIRRYQRLVAANRISLALAKERSMDQIKSLRFDDGKAFIWINDLGKPIPQMLMHPINAELNDAVLDDPKYSTDNQNVFAAMVSAVEESGEGYVHHSWPVKSESGEVQNIAKLSYVRGYQKWGWVLGTSIEIDDIKADMESKIRTTVRDMRYADGAGYFWISDNSLPYARMIMHPTKPELEGTVLSGAANDSVIDSLGGDGKQNLFNAFSLLTKDGENQAFVNHTITARADDGSVVDKPMLSYVRMHKESGWVVGSQIDPNDIDVVAVDQSAPKENKVSIINAVMTLIAALVAILISYLFSHRITRPLNELAAKADQISRGKDLDKPLADTDRKDEIGVLANALDRLRVSAHIMLKREQKR